MAQWGNYTPWKHEDLNLDPQHPLKNRHGGDKCTACENGQISGAYRPASTAEATSSRLGENLVSNTKVESSGGRYMMLASGLYTYTHEEKH